MQILRGKCKEKTLIIYIPKPKGVSEQLPTAGGA